MTGPRVLWLRPTKPDNISVGRERIAAHLRERGYDVTIRDASGLDALGAAREATGGDYDVVVGTVRMGLYVGYPLSRLLGVPLVADVTDPIEQIADLPAPLYRFLYEYEHFVLARADDRLFTYASALEKARDRGIEGHRVENGVDFDAFADPNDSVVDRAREELREAGVSLEAQVAVYVGGLTPVYHVRSMLEAAEYRPGTEFVFLGDGPLVGAVESAAADAPNVHFLGTYDHSLVPGFLAHADVGFCLVDAEQPLKVLEYGAAGLPVLAAPGELQTRFTGDELEFVDPTPEAIAAALAALEEADGRAAALGRHLRERAEASDWSKIAMQYQRVIEEVTDG